jgi:hypothetical protein
MVNIFIQPVDTSHILIVFLNNKWSPHLYFCPLAIYCTNFLYFTCLCEATAVWSHSYDAVVITLYYLLCALKDNVPGLSIFREAVFCKRHFWRRFSRILPVPLIPFSLSLVRRDKLVIKLSK